MILFLYGVDIYRSNQKLKNLKAKYVEKYGDTNLETFEDGFELGKIKGAITALPFLADKRLVIIKNIFKSKSKDILDGISEILEYVPEETITIFWEEAVPDKRTVLFKKLIKEKSEEFEKLQGYKLTKWIEDDVADKGGKISGKNAEKLASYVGDDLNQLENEIAKLVTFRSEGEISSEDIDLLVNSKLSGNIFNLVDAVGTGDYRKTAQYMHELLAQGENEIYILTMIVRQFRNLILIKDYEGKLDKIGIAKEVGLHPFVVQKGMAQARKFSIQELKNMYEKLLDTDIAIKTGEKEPLLALDLLVKELCK
ncbi:DNA polymerase III subunit delta [bacterium (Candidatus Howlettbacteria) CG_4_10_14_0_8_um_filter_40_9]|nr:MAG: DNA polymerase III subunit delta [bacterium (Candidatus Howlettbacteria) CG_4_10_14_0_8_um_filter_40_9]